MRAQLGSLVEALERLKNGQREAVQWNAGPLLVLAGPGSGKTTVLTLRIARLLQESAKKSFRILALTFTNKAASEMRSRLEGWVPELMDRVNVGTFHSFCAEILRTHGSHIGLTPDFKIFPTEADQLDVLEDILRVRKSRLESDKALRAINHLRANLIALEDVPKIVKDAEFGVELQAIYQAYHQGLLSQNALDFEGLIFWVVQLLTKHPKLADHYRRVYPYWCIDECQDTNLAQFKLLTVLSGGVHKNIFAVADDDQVLYEWNGASHKRLKQFQKEFEADTVQLPTNYRCPLGVVELANRLISHNRNRIDRQELRAAKGTKQDGLQFWTASCEDDQFHLIAEHIRSSGIALDSVAILARSKKQLQAAEAALKAESIACEIVQKRSDFVSAQFRFLMSSLRLSLERNHPRKWKAFLDSYRQLSRLQVDEVAITTGAQQAQGDLLFTFCQHQRTVDPTRVSILEDHLIAGNHRSYVDKFLAAYSASEPSEDFEEDRRAWQSLVKEVDKVCGKQASLPRFLQELDLRSKEPPPTKTPKVQLLTVHSSKGKEFPHVFVVGLAEGSFPSYQATLEGDASPQMEEERRSCYVSITRTLSNLTLVYPKQLNGYSKKPSRFLAEMGLVQS